MYSKEASQLWSCLVACRPKSLVHGITAARGISGSNPGYAESPRCSKVTMITPLTLSFLASSILLSASKPKVCPMIPAIPLWEIRFQISAFQDIALQRAGITLWESTTSHQFGSELTDWKVVKRKGFAFQRSTSRSLEDKHRSEARVTRITERTQGERNSERTQGGKKFWARRPLKKGSR